MEPLGIIGLTPCLGHGTVVRRSDLDEQKECTLRALLKTFCLLFASLETQKLMGTEQAHDQKDISKTNNVFLSENEGQQFIARLGKNFYGNQGRFLLARQDPNDEFHSTFRVQN